MHTRLIAVAAALAVVILPACAQRGGAHPGSAGHAGSFAVHSAPSFRGGFSAPSRPSFMAPARFSSSRYTLNQRFPQRATGAGYANHRPGNDRDLRDRGFRYRQPYIPNYGLGLPYGAGYSVGYLPDFLDYPDSSFDGNSGYAAAPQQPQEDYPPDQFLPPPVDQPYPAPAPIYRPAYQGPQQPAPEPEPGLPVTLVFKDGRPNQQIQNYLLTRTTLYVQDQRLRLIPVDQLDLVAMNKINSDAGVEFNLPGSTQ